MDADDHSSATPEERAEELARLLQTTPGTNEVTRSADDGGAIVTCYAYRDHADEIRRLATDSQFDIAHQHDAGDERYYVFGYSVPGSRQNNS